MSLSKLLLSAGKKALTKQAKTPATGQAVATRPMEMGRVAPREKPIFGSVTYDRIAQKGPGEFSADEWADWLVDRGKRRVNLFGQNFEEGFITGKRFKLDQKFAKGSRFFNKEQTVPVEELFDSNVATFDRAGNLTGGMLYQAQQAGVKLPGKVLADMVKLNPAYRLKINELGIPQNVIDNASNKLTQAGYRLQSIERAIDRSAIKAINETVGDVTEKDIKGIAVELSDNLKRAQSELKVLRNAAQSGNRSAVEDSAQKFASIMKAIKVNANNQQKIVLNQLQGEVDDVVANVSKGTPPKYQDQSGYTFPGGKNYQEAVLSLDESIPLNNNFGRMGNPHYSQDRFRNPIVHIRFDTRTTSDGKRAFLIHEIQSDSNQGISKYLRNKNAEPFNTSLRTNPYQNDVMIGFLANARNKLSNDILNRKIPPGQMESTTKRIKALDKQLGDITRQSQMTRYTAGAVRGAPERVDYFPLLDRSSTAKAALSYLTNKAAREGVDYVAISPATQIRRGIKNDGDYDGPPNFKSYLEFYGTKTGKKQEGGKGLAVIPDLLKKIGSEFDVTAGPIKIAKSDPSKPFKRIDDYEVRVGDRVYKNTAHTEVSNKKLPGFKEMRDDQLALYDDYFSVKVSPNMIEPQRLYKKEGGFISKR